MNIVRIIKLGIMVFDRIKYTIRGCKVGREVEFGRNIHFRQSIVGNYSYIGNNSIINHAVIGAYCSIAPGVQIGGMEHSVENVSTNTHLSGDCVFGNQTYIEADVWIAASSIIKQGVRIGQGAVVGANSFVNKDVPPYAIVVGSPAKVIRYRFSDDVIQKLICSTYWKLSPSDAKKMISSII